MIKIPVRVLEENNISTDHLDDEYGTYNTFLIVTDRIVKEAFEVILDDPANFQANLIEFVAKNKELLDYRKLAKKEIEKLEV